MLNYSYYIVVCCSKSGSPHHFSEITYVNIAGKVEQINTYILILGGKKSFCFDQQKVFVTITCFPFWGRRDEFLREQRQK